jgi:hypothetical protein
VCSDCHSQAVGLKACLSSGCHNNPANIGTTVTRSGGTTYTATDVNAEFNLDNASRHNVLGSSVGMKSKFDGTDLAQGPASFDDSGNVITQVWTVPTADVFWSQRNSTTGTNTAPATANTAVGPDSVISCTDCHTGSDVAGAAGPHGSSTQWMLDPNYPDDWKKAEITTWDPTGMRSILTTLGSSNPYYSKPPTMGAGYSAGDIPIKMICQKCHKLMNPLQGIPAQTRAGRSQQGFGLSNEAHMEHHADQILGQGNCIACHIAIPHGWKRPRLLVNSDDPAPYVASQPTTATGGNWIYVSSAFGTSTHLDRVNANFQISREESSGPASGGWDQTRYGILWEGDPLDEPVAQTNCNACSATGGTHVPASAANPSGEGIPTTSPTWR